MKTKNEIIADVDELLKLDEINVKDFESIKSNLNNLSDVDKNEVIEYFIQKLYPIEDIKNFYLRYSEHINDRIFEAIQDFKNITGYSDSEIKEFFNNAGIEEENIKQMVEKDLDLELIEIKEKANEEGISLEEWLKNDVQRLEAERDEKLAEIDKQIEEVENNLENTNVKLSDYIEDTINKLKQEQNDIVAKSGEYPSGEDEKRFHEINAKIDNLKSLSNNYDNLGVDNIDDEINKLKQELNDIVKKSGEYPSKEDEKRFHEINDLISFLNQSKTFLNEKNKENISANHEKYVSELKNKVNTLKKEQNDIVAKSGGYPSEEDEKRYHEINSLISNINKRIEFVEANKDLNQKDLAEKIEKLLSEQRDIVAKSGGYPSEEDEKRFHEINETVNFLKELQENKFGKGKKGVNKNVNELKNERKKVKRKYDTLIAKRKKQLEKLKKKHKNGYKKGNRKDLVVKSLAGLAGFGVGLALSSTPGVGQIRMTIATAKLIQSGVKVWTKKYPEGKISKISSKLSDKTQRFGEKHPRIASAYKKAKKIMEKDKVQWFVNGVAAGYITGNIIEMTTGKTVGEHLFSSDDTKDVASVAKGTTQTTPPDTSATPDVPSNTPTDINVTPGQNYDLSGLSQGLVSADSQDYVNILGQYSKDAIVDKFHTLPNGEVMVHFKSALDGQGLAWYKLADIKEYLAQGAEVVENVSRNL